VKTRADFIKIVDDLSAKLNGNFLLHYKLDKTPNVKTFIINLPTEKELTDTKITARNCSIELKSKLDVQSNVFLFCFYN
jgi:hypothetical protein